MKFLRREGGAENREIMRSRVRGRERATVLSAMSKEKRLPFAGYCLESCPLFLQLHRLQKYNNYVGYISSCDVDDLFCIYCWWG